MRLEWNIGLLSRRCGRLGLVLALGAVACDGSPDRGVVGPSEGSSEDRGTEVSAATGEALKGLGHAVYGVGKLKRSVPDPCPDPGHEGFDFWLGTWELENADTGAPVGTSVITSELDGCVVMEDVVAVNGFPSRSLSVFDPATGDWHQSFVTGNTTNIRFTGGLQGDAMVMTASAPAFDFATGTVGLRENRVTWRPNPDGTLSQVVEASFEGTPRPTVEFLYEPTSSIDRPDRQFLPFCQASVIPGFRELDFWLGSWEVSATEGPKLGSSEVATRVNDCLIVEDFVTPKGMQSRSYVFYDFATATWHRSYIDENGEYVTLSGALEQDGGSPRMVMTGTDVGPNGEEFDLRVTIEPLGPDLVRQAWEVSDDGGASWKPALSLDYEAS